MIPTLIIAFLVAVNAFYVAAEYSLVGVGRLRAGRMVREGHLGASLVLNMVADAGRLDRAITACQIGISASSMALGAYSQMVLAPTLVPYLRAQGLSAAAAVSAAVTVTLVAVTSLQVIFGEQVPKSMAVRNPPRWSRVTAAPLWLSARLFTPVTFFLSGTANLALRLIGLPSLPEQSLHSVTEIAWMVGKSAEAGKVADDLHGRLHNALHMAARRARDVMEPRVSVEAVPDTVSLDELRDTLRRTGYTRLPVYRGSLDDIIGFVHAKDLLLEEANGAPPRLTDSIRPVLLVSWSMNTIELVETMRDQHAGLAVVVDERGGTAGVVTLERLVEQVLGEMKDEFDRKGPRFGRLAGGGLRLKAEEPVADLNVRYGLGLEIGEARTLGGLVMENLSRVARPGDVVEVSGWRLEVERARGPRIETVLVRPAPLPPAAGGEPS